MEAYHATISSFSSSGGTLSGTAVVIVTRDFDGNAGPLFYGGSVAGVAPGLDAANCPAKNGCGVHLHTGTGCEDLLAQEGHYYDADELAEDPWETVRYSSDGGGRAVFGGFVDVGAIAANDLLGRAFLGALYWALPMYLTVDKFERKEEEGGGEREREGGEGVYSPVVHVKLTEHLLSLITSCPRKLAR